MSGKLTYKQSGVDTKEAAAFVSDISSHVKRTQKQRSLHQAFGLFAAAYDLSSYKEPVIVTGCDGVGTKTEILFELDMVETAGKDLVAMNVNDILTTGGDPLLFLDYLGISNLERERSRITRLVAGMCDYLESCNCILAGGETAEMPGVVPESIVELSGFCIGCCEKSKLIDPKTVRPGDVFIGYKSDSFHANGWSLIRRILEENPDVVDEEELRSLLQPTRLYHDVGRYAPLQRHPEGIRPYHGGRPPGKHGTLPGRLRRRPLHSLLGQHRSPENPEACGSAGPFQHL